MPMQLSLVMLLNAITLAPAQDVGDVPRGEVGDPQAGPFGALCGDPSYRW